MKRYLCLRCPPYAPFLRRPWVKIHWLNLLTVRFILDEEKSKNISKMDRIRRIWKARMHL